MPTEADRLATSRRAFLKGTYFTRDGRRRFAIRQQELGFGPPARVSIDPLACIAWQRMACRACADACRTNAIRMVSGLEPRIDGSSCTRCADCAGVCPVNAVQLVA